MRNVTLLTLLLVAVTHAQERGTISNSSSKLIVKDFAYPVFLNNEVHSSFDMTYTFSNKLHMTLNGAQNTYLFQNRFRSSLLLKRYLTKNLYVIGGMGIEMILNEDQRITGTPSNTSSSPPRLSAIGGFGYDVSNNLSLEAKGDFSLNKTTIGAFGESFIRMPQIYTLKGKFSF